MIYQQNKRKGVLLYMQFSSKLSLIPTKIAEPVLKKRSYRAAILHVIKETMQQTDPSMLNKLYGNNSMQKQFATAFYLDNVQFEQGTDIKVNNGASITFKFSSNNEEISIAFLNVFMALAAKKKTKLTPAFDISIAYPKIYQNMNIGNSETIIIKTVSPIVINDHKDKKDYFYSAKANYQKFEELLKDNLKFELITFNELDLVHKVDELNIIPINVNKSVQTSYDLDIECSTGSFVLSADPALLNYIINNGLGSKRGLGFGLLRI